MRRGPEFRPVLAAALTALGLLGAVAAAPQETPGPLPGVFGEVLDVRVVNLEVVVTDKQGIPIAGLGPADFRLLVDGEETPIDYFTEVRGGVAVEEGAGEAPVPGVPALAPGGRVETSYLVFIDEYFSVRTDRDRVLEALAEDLPLLGPGDRMAVVAFDGEQLEMLSTWSGEVAHLERVFDRARERPAWGLQRLAERRQARLEESTSLTSLLAIGGGPRTIDRVYLEPQERFYVQRLGEQVDRSVAAATATLRSFAKPPGRKVMLLLSGGWPFFPIEYLYSDFDRIILDREGLAGEDLYSRLTDTANLLGYTLYPVDVPGLDRDAIDVTADAADASTIGDRGFLREQEIHYTLSHLAEETGGRAFINASRLDALAKTVSDTRSYYWLGFSPGRAWDDQRHRVRIETVNPDFRVRSRADFLDTSREREVSMAVESTLLFGHSPGTGSLQVELGEPRRDGRRMQVPITLSMPVEELTFVPTGDTWTAQLELRVAVVDEDGHRAEIPVIPLGLEVAEEPQPGQRGSYSTSLRLRRKEHRAVVAIYDSASGRILSSSLEIRP